MTTPAAAPSVPATGTPASVPAAAAAPGAIAPKATPAVAAPGTPPVTPPADPDLSRQFAQLAKKELLITQREKKAAELEKKYAPLAAVDPKSDLGAFMKAHNISVDDVIQYKLTEGKPPTDAQKVLTVEEKLAKMEADWKADKENSERSRIEERVQSFKNQIKAHTDTDLGKYELITAHGAHEEVFNVCSRYYNENKDKPGFKPLEISRAADLVEEELFQTAKTKYSGIKKYKSLFTDPAAPAPDTATRATDTPPPQSDPTLSNRGTTPSAASTKLLPREQAIKAIAAQYDGKL